MAISRESKEKAVAQLSTDLGRIKLAVMTDYRGLSVPEIEELRGILRDEGISYRVTKNTLLRLATQSTPALKNIDQTAFTGPMALALGFDDEVAAARRYLPIRQEARCASRSSEASPQMASCCPRLRSKHWQLSQPASNCSVRSLVRLLLRLPVSSVLCQATSVPSLTY